MARRQPSCQIIGVTNMGTGDRDRLHELFDAALDADESGRIAILAAAEVEDPEMAAELKRLLGKFCEDSAFLESSPFPNMAEMVPDKDDDTWGSDPGDSLPTLDSRPAKTTLGPFREPERVGAYTVLRKIGEGGMGAVYLARQDRPEREVALKLIHRQKVTPSFLARFEREYRVLAMMSHHNIARIFEAGQTEEGDPFFTMEHVDGLPITDYCRRHALDLQNRLRLFVQVCDGVRHAHQKAVVHRDLKPNNILVTTLEGKPVVKLIDFGIAKDLSVEETALQTQTGAFMGTPVYMSPEQIASGGGSDTRSDVYALGVILYELLTGLPPIDPDKLRNRSLFDLLEAYRDTEPPRPSRRLEEAESELALRDFSLELRGDLDWVVMKALDKDIERRYQSPGELEEDLRRYLAGRTVAARPPTITYQLSKFTQRNRVLVGSGLLVFLALITALWVSISANARTTRALERQQQANQYLRDMLSAPDPRNVGLNAKVIDLLESFEAGLEDIKDPVFEADIRATLGDTYYGLSDYQNSERYHRRALDLRKEELGETHPATLRSQYSVARAIRRLGKVDEAEKILNTTLQRQQAELGFNHIDPLYSEYQLALVYLKRGQYKKVISIYQELIPRMEQILGAKDQAVLRAYNGLALSLKNLGDYQAAAAAYGKAEEGQLTLLGYEHPETLSTLGNRANLLRVMGYEDKAEAIYRDVLETRARRLGRQHPLTWSTAYSLCLSISKHNPHASVALIEETVGFRLEQHGWESDSTTRALTLLGLIYCFTDSPDTGNAIFDDILTGHVIDRPSSELPFIFILHARVLRELEDTNGSIGSALLNIHNPNLNSVDDLFNSYMELGDTVSLLDDPEWEAEAYCHAWAVYDSQPTIPNTIEARAKYGLALGKLGKYDRGREHINFAERHIAHLTESRKRIVRQLSAELEAYR